MSAIGQGSISVDDNAEAAENAQEIANKGANGVKDINSDNKLTPNEKLSLKRLYDSDVLKHDFDVKQLTSMSLPTTNIDLALSNLTSFTAKYFVNMDITETVDRQALNKVFNDFDNADKAVEGLFNDAVQRVADDAKKAGDDAKEVGEKAQEAGEEAKASADQAKADATQAKSDAATAQQKAQSSIDQLNEATTKFDGEIAEAKTSASQAQSAADNAFNQAKTVGSQASSAIAVQSAATAKAQSTADSAFNQAKTAIDNGKVTSQAVTDLKDGSTLTIAQLGNGLASKVANSDFASYKTQTANQIGQMVTNSTFSAYQQTTADLISSKVATKDFNTYTSQTAKAISSKVESQDFNSYKTQTDKAILSKVSTTDFNSLTISNRNLALGTATPMKIVGQNINNQTPVAYGFSSTIPRGTVVTVSFDVSSSTGVGNFAMLFYGFDPGSNWQSITNGNLVKGTKHVSATITTTGSNLHVCPRLDFATGDVTFSNFIISESSKEVGWTQAPEDLATQSQITQLSGEIDQKVSNGDFSTYKTQTANLIGSKVSNNQYQSDKTQTANLISQTVSSAVDGLKIGGTNLIKNSKFDDKMNNWRIWCPQGMGTSTVQINPTGGGGDWPRQAIYSAKIINTEADKNNQFGIAQDSVPVEPNAEYTFQLFNDGADPITVQHGNGSNDPYVTKVLGSHRTTWTFKIPADVYNTNIYIGFNSGQSGTAWISLTKLEKGNKATDWSLNPEDQATESQITQLSGEIDQKVDSGDFSSYKTQTADLIGSKVANSDFSTYKTQTAQLIGSKVSSNDFESYKTQTADMISSKVSTVDFNNLTISNRNLALGTATAVTMNGENRSNQVQVGYQFSSVIPNGTLVTATFDITSSTGVGSFMVQFNGNDQGASWQNISSSNLVKGTKHVTTTIAVDADQLHVYFRLDNATGDITFSNFIISESSKEVSYSPAPEDLATSTEFDQLSNAIKLKADSSDVTSQINVATKGIQNEVNNKVTDLTTQINQTSDAVQILNTTSGLRNLVYNSSYANNAEGWDLMGIGYLSTFPASSYNGSPGFGVNISGKGATTWTEFGRSKNYTLSQSIVDTTNTYSASAMVKMYSDSDSTAKLGATIAYFDKNGARISGWKDMLIDYNKKMVWTEVKFENFPVPQGAYSIGIQYWAYGSKVHGMIAQPMIVFGPKIGPYNPDAVSQSDITASIDNIHLGVKNADGSTSNFNMNGNTILMDTAQTIISGKTSILDGTIDTAKIANAAINTAQIADGAINNAKIANAAIDDAKISNLNGNKIIAGSITSKQLNADDIIANVINGKTINGITINTPNLQLGTNGILSEDWTLNQATSLFDPKKGSGTMTLTQGLLATEGTLSRWWAGDGGYWYGIGDDGVKIKNGSNQIGDNYGAGYAQHNIFDSKGNTLLRTYMDATGIYMNSGGTSNVNTVLTQQGLTTTNVAALGGINGASLTTNGTFKAALGTKNTYGFSVESQVVSPMIRANSYTYSSNVFISSYGTMGLATSTKANKLDIVDVPNMLQKGYNLLTLNPRQWFDKTSVEAYADVQSGNSESIESVVNIKPVTGMVAEEVASAGLDDYVVKDENNKVQGLAYDRLWTLLLPVLRDMNDKINKLQKKAGI